MATLRTGRLKEETHLTNICVTWPAGTKAQEQILHKGHPPSWVLSTEGVEVGAMGRHDLRIRFPTVSESRIEIDP